LAMGGLAIYIAVQLYREYRFAYLASNAAMIVGFGVLTLSNTIETFIKASIPDDARSPIFESFSAWARLLVPLVMIFVAYQFVRVCFGLLRKPAPRWTRPAAAVLGCFFLAARIYGTIRPRAVPNLSYVLLVAFNSIFYAAAGAALVFFLAALRNREAGSERRSLRILGVVCLVFIAFLSALTVTSIRGWLSPDAVLLALSAAIAAFNPVFVILFRRHHRRFAVIAGSEFDVLADRFALTSREREIVGLICRGRSNKDIAAALFISPLTARDHLSKIFVKTGVKSRLALASLFHRGEDGNRPT